jgi:hypothetical protein
MTQKSPARLTVIDPGEMRNCAVERHVAALRFRLDRERFTRDMEPAIGALQGLTETAWKKNPLERGRTLRMLGDALTDLALATDLRRLRKAITAYRQAALLLESSGDRSIDDFLSYLAGC